MIAASGVPLQLGRGALSSMGAVFEGVGRRGTVSHDSLTGSLFRGLIIGGRVHAYQYRCGLVFSRGCTGVEFSCGELSREVFARRRFGDAQGQQKVLQWVTKGALHWGNVANEH